MKWYFQLLFESIWHAFRLFVVVCVSMQSQDILFSIKCQEPCASKHILYYYWPNISFSSFDALYKFCVNTIARNIKTFFLFAISRPSFCMQYQDLHFVCNIKTCLLKTCFETEFGGLLWKSHQMFYKLCVFLWCISQDIIFRK